MNLNFSTRFWTNFEPIKLIVELGLANIKEQDRFKFSSFIQILEIPIGHRRTEWQTDLYVTGLYEIFDVHVSLFKEEWYVFYEAAI